MSILPTIMMTTGILAFIGLLIYGIRTGRLGGEPAKRRKRRKARRKTAVIRKVAKEDDVMRMYAEKKDKTI